MRQSRPSNLIGIPADDPSCVEVYERAERERRYDTRHVHDAATMTLKAKHPAYPDRSAVRHVDFEEWDTKLMRKRHKTHPDKMRNVLVVNS